MTHPSLVFQHERPDALTRTVLGLSNGFGRLSGIGSGLDTAELRRAAEQKTGLSDWGDDFAQETFEKLVASALGDARLNFVGRFSLRKAIIGQLSNWLRLVDQRTRFPELLNQPVRNPIIVAGPPRTGTTLLHHLLCSHPDAIFLPMWWAMRPLPAPSASEWDDHGSAERRAMAERACGLMNRVIPSMKHIHDYHPDYPVECSYLSAPAFHSNQFGAWPLYTYFEQLGGFDAGPGYACYRQHLQLMQAHLPGDHWVLKSPGHFVTLGGLVEGVPNATIVVTHRDPARVFPSLNSMLAAHQVVTSDELDFQRMSDAVVGLFHQAATQYLELREQHPGRFVDVRFHELMADPLGTAERIYRSAGARWDDEVQSTLQAFLDRRVEESQHAHPYPSSQYGFTPESLRERFAAYIDAVGIQVP
ncbi:MAG: sulfotransferase [Alphaproteobacteria bacterium]|nr:sulfotransferase [Alphaproteobacteria bacterium]